MKDALGDVLDDTTMKALEVRRRVVGMHWVTIQVGTRGWVE